MPTPELFRQACQWSALLMLASGIFTTLAFIFKWGIRFRFVGGDESPRRAHG